MLAVDTNVLVRFLTADHPRQFALARRLIATNQISVPLTVILETERVLRDGYGYSRDQVASVLGDLLSLTTVHVEHEARIRTALKWTTHGMDFADALHVAGAGDCESFVSFDRDLLRAGRRIGVSMRAP